MNNLIIVHIESLDNRYTKQWREHIPEEFSALGYNIINIDGEEYTSTQEGAFFNFSSSCKYKSSQAVVISSLFQDNKVLPGDIFFFTDAWNQTVHYVKYMIELNKIKNVTVMGIWHAGAYDPTDILGYTISDKRWVTSLEQSMYYAYDYNFFGTEQHRLKFVHNLDFSFQNYHIQLVQIT